MSANGTRPQIVVATPVPATVIERLRSAADVVDVSELPRAQWKSALGDAAGLLVSSNEPVNAELLAQAPQLRNVATVAVGYDNVDLAALASRGIALSNSRGSLVEAVADHAYALVILSMRRLAAAMAWARSGRWLKAPAPFGHDVAAATLGIVGMGAIGAAVARRARVSGMQVIYSNRRQRPDDAETGAAYRTFDQLLAEADCVVVIVPLTPESRKMFDAAAFAKMKPGAAFVNVARGAVVDTDALVASLESGRLAAAALDVVDPQPLPTNHPLFAREDVIIMPHMGSATFETRERMALLGADNLIAALAGKPLLTPVALD